MDCITNGNREGNLTDDQARLASDLYIGLDVEYQGKMNRGAAAARAAKETFESLQKLASEKERKKLLQVQAFKQVDKNLNEYRGFGDKQDYAKAAEALIEQDIFQNILAWCNVNKLLSKELQVKCMMFWLHLKETCWDLQETKRN